MTKEYFCIKVSQRGVAEVEFVNFVVLAKDVESWSDVRRVGEAPQGTQRILKEPRVKAIKRFFSSSPQNTIPVSAILAFEPGTVTFTDLTTSITDCLGTGGIDNGVGDLLQYGRISFEFDPETAETFKPAIIVDGQHRIKGMSASDENLPISVAAYIGADAQEQAFQFVVINNKAQKVPTDNVKAIIRNINEGELQTRLLQAGVSYGKYPATLGDIDELEESPFYKLLDWPLNQTGNKQIQLTTIESCLRYIKDALPILAEDEDSLKALFMTSWSAIKETYPTLWEVNEKFMSKVNIVATNEFIVDKLENGWIDGNTNLYESSEVHTYIRRTMEEIPVEFWTSDWLFTLQDNAVVRSRIKDDLRKITQNIRAGRSWNDGLKNISQ